jgi:D-alanyl-D-alanine dipeptidase
MALIQASVGEKGANQRADVATIQTLLNQRITAFGTAPLRGDGVCDAATIQAIRNYQIRILGVRKATGRVDPTSPMADALANPDSAAVRLDIVKAEAARNRLSGADWFRANQAKYPNSSSVSDLTPAFAAQVNSFLAALRLAGATIHISATLRNRTRVYLMHYSWMLAHGAIKPSDVPADPNTDIIWDHGDAKETRDAARAMVKLFGIAFKPSLTSNHMRGTAIDMTIHWAGPIEIADAAGKKYSLDQPRSGNTNTVLHGIGASYGVRKLSSDPPHWSADGH